MTQSLDLSGAATVGTTSSPVATAKVAAKPLQWSTTDQEAENHGVKILVYGGAGSGKTWFCGTAPSPVIISAEAGLLTLRRKKIPVIKVTDIHDVENALTWCKTEALSHGFLTVCLDSISEIAEKCLQNEKAKTKDPRQAYGELANQVLRLIKEFRDIPGLHCIITAKQAVAQDAISGITKASPTAPGQQVGPAMPYLFDEVFHAYAGKDPTTGDPFHALQTHASMSADAKDRSGVLDAVEYPDANYLITKILATPPEAVEAQPAPATEADAQPQGATS